jgi:allantoicase
MSDGWENARRRGAGNDYVIVRLAAAGQLQYAEIDTSCFVGNAPGWIRLSAADDSAAAGSAGHTGGDPAGMSWQEILPRTRVQPDTRHRFLLDSPRAATHLRLDVIPDGGLARLRAYGQILPETLAHLRRCW